MHQVQRLLPQQEEAILRAAAIQRETERVRTEREGIRQSGESARMDAVARMVADQNVTTRAALELVARSQADNSRAFDHLQENVADVGELRDRLRLMEKREESFREYQSELESVDDEKMIKLTSKVRPQIAEMALPLRKSASSLALTAGEERMVSARLNREEAQDINSRQIDDQRHIQRAGVVAYDRQTGVGKLDLPDLSLHRVSFNVPPGSRSRLRPKIAEALDQESVDAAFRLFRDQSGEITSVVLDDIIPPPVQISEEDWEALS